MTVTRSARIDNIGFSVSDDPAQKGAIAVRWAKLIHDGPRLVARECHRAVLNPGDDVDAAMAAVDSDLSAQGFGAMPESDVALVRQQTARLWTAATVSAYKAALERRTGVKAAASG